MNSPHFEKLVKLAPPPAKPHRPGTPVEWDRAEQELEVKFPTDFKQLVRTYGTGVFGNRVWAHSPFFHTDPPGADNPRSDFADWVAMHRRMNREMSTPNPGSYVHTICTSPTDRGADVPVWPEPGGVLPVGYISDGNLLAWRTVGAPDQWTVLGAFPREDRFVEFKTGIADFIYLMLTEPELAGRFWGVMRGPMVFHPYVPKAKGD